MRMEVHESDDEDPSPKLDLEESLGEARESTSLAVDAAIASNDRVFDAEFTEADESVALSSEDSLPDVEGLTS